MAWNCQSLNPKIIEFRDHIISNNIDIALLNETWLTAQHTLYVPSYTIYRSDRQNAAHGGVAIIIKNNIKHTQIPFINTEIIEQVGIKVYTNTDELHIFSCYFPGSTNRDVLRKYKHDIIKLTTHTRKSYFLIGDFNAKHRLWNNVRANTAGNILYEETSKRNFVIHHPPTPTYYPTQARFTQPSTIDIAITNNLHTITQIQSMTALSSDHNPIEFKIECEHTHNNDKYKLRYDLTDWKKFQDHISRNIILSNSQPTNTDEVDSIIRTLTEIITDATSRHIPKTKYKINTIPFSNDLKQLITHRNSIRRSWQRNQIPQLKLFLKKLNYDIKQKCFSARNKQFSNHVENMNVGVSKFWKITKLLKNKIQKMPPLRDTNTNRRIFSDTEKANAIAQQFHSHHNTTLHFNNPQNEQTVKQSINIVQNTLPDTSSTFHYHTKPKEIRAIIKSLRLKKAPGIDGINNTILKKLPRKAIVLLNTIFNACINLSYFPSEWKIAKVVAIAKPNKDHTRTSSYRPISLLNSISKIFEKIVLHRLNNYIELEQIFPNTQFGFRPQHSTTHQLARVVNHLKTSQQNQKSTGLVTLDIEKAFDSIWHDALIHKMVTFGFPIVLTKIIYAFLLNRSFYVQINTEHSNTYTIPAGVPQGSCLSPTLYNIFTSDFPRNLNCHTAQFADDTALYKSSLCPTEITQCLEVSLNTVNEYFKKWRIQINGDKSQAIFISRRRAVRYLPQTHIQTLDYSIEWSNNIKYLGLNIDKKLIFRNHIELANIKAQRYIKILYPLINRKSKLKLKNKLILYKSIFRPMMLYANEIWSFAAKTHTNKLQITQNKILKLIYDLPYYYSTHRLHELSQMNTINTYIDTRTQTFQRNCQYSINPLINNLYIV